MNTVYLICFVLGLVLSVLAVFTGGGRLHFGHGHFHTHLHAHPKASSHIPALNGFTLPAFLCWFGGAGYLLHNYSPLIMPLILVVATLSGIVGAGVIYAALFKFLLPHEQVLTEEATRMDGVVARVTDEIRPDGGIGEIISSQIGTRRSAAARSEDGKPIPRGTEVVVLRYAHGIAYVSPLEDHLEEHLTLTPRT
jgi:membrane protein implicated in regulation of membrane protease activity